MIGKYNKTITIEGEDNEVKAVVIFNEKLHLPVFYTVNKCGMDDILNLLNKDNEKNYPA